MKVKIKTADFYPKLHTKDNLWMGLNNLPEYMVFDAEFASPPSWFFNSKGDVQESLAPTGKEHEKRMAFGNAYYSKKEAENARDSVKNLLS